MNVKSRLLKFKLLHPFTGITMQKCLFTKKFIVFVFILLKDLSYHKIVTCQRSRNLMTRKGLIAKKTLHIIRQTPPKKILSSILNVKAKNFSLVRWNLASKCCRSSQIVARPGVYTDQKWRSIKHLPKQLMNRIVSCFIAGIG